VKRGKFFSRFTHFLRDHPGFVALMMLRAAAVGANVALVNPA
jgi:hypothetical protein